MTNIIAVINIKGGVGKTTTSMYLATILADHGKVLLKDSDQQGSLENWAEQIENKPFDFMIANLNNIGKNTEGYDYVIIDTPPQNPQIIQAAIDLADMVIAPTEASALEVGQACLTMNSVNKDIIKKILLTRVNTITKSFKSTKVLLDEGGYDYFKTCIPRLEAIKGSVGYLPEKPEELEHYSSLVDEILQDFDRREKQNEYHITREK